VALTYTGSSCSTCHISSPFFVASVVVRVFLLLSATFTSSRWGGVSPSPNSWVGRQPFVGCLWLLIQYIRNYRPYPEAVSSTSNVGRTNTYDRDQFITEMFAMTETKANIFALYRSKDVKCIPLHLHRRERKEHNWGLHMCSAMVTSQGSYTGRGITLSLQNDLTGSANHLTPIPSVPEAVSRVCVCVRAWSSRVVKWPQSTLDLRINGAITPFSLHAFMS
jgi:hypothetical protein